ncbi:MAG: response regulator [Acidobacteria bacterium]|nr:response regulator [Acidobacteriota bacterium]
MVQFNTRANEILLKLVYYGPGLSGKTTNLQQLHALCAEGQRGDMFSVNTQEDRTLFFDLLPINLGYIYGNAIHLQVYTVPGQVQYDASRRVVLGGADGVVFVADSGEAKMQDNVDSLSNLYHNLNANRLNIKQIPLVLQFNKRDLKDALPVGVMNRRLNFRNAPFFEAIAASGIGVGETFRAITRETVEYTFKKFALDKKVKDFEAMLALIDSNLSEALRDVGTAPAPGAGPEQPPAVVLRHSGVTIDDLHPERHADPQELLSDALKSSMETARLYSDLRGAKDEVEQRNQELGHLYAQLEHSHQENQKTRRYLESLIQNMGDALTSFGADGRILTWNGAAESTFGYGRSEALGQPFVSLLPESDRAILPDLLARVGAGEVVRHLHGTALRRSGETFPADLRFAPVRGAEDRVVAVSALIREQAQAGSLDPLEPAIAEARAIMETASTPEVASRAGKLLQLLDAMRPKDGAPAASARLDAKRVLIVEDQPELLDLFHESVLAIGHAAVSASAGEEAIRLLQGGNFDLIVSDIRMPGLSGIELFGWIRAHQPRMERRILFTTGDAYDAQTLEFLERNQLPCLPKPFDLRQFQARVGELLAV